MKNKRTLRSLALFILLSLTILFVGCPTTTDTLTAPTAPVLTATAADSQVTVSWAAVTDASSYNLYWATATGVTTANGTKIENVTSPYVHTGLTNATTYHYVATAVNEGGESEASAEVSATPVVAAAAPSAPTNVAVAATSANAIQVSWTAVTGATSYNVYWSMTTGVTTANGTKITSATSPYSHTGLTGSTTYYYVVTAVNAVGESAASTQVSATTSTAPAAPGSFTAIAASSSTVQTAWTAVTGATSYNLYWSTTAGVTKSSTKVAGVTNPYTHSSLTTGTTYYYAVTAVDANGESALSTEASAAPAPYIEATAYMGTGDASPMTQTVSVYTDITKSTPITDLTVTFNDGVSTYTLPYNSSQGGYYGTNTMSTGATLTIDVLDGIHYVVTGTQYSTLPVITTSSTWDADLAYDVSWTAASPLTGNYWVGVYNTSMSFYYGPSVLALDTTSVSVPSNTSATTGSYMVQVGIFQSVSYSTALTGSYLVFAAFKLKSITIN